ncbi:Protein of unknown function [Bacillus wiedmannii]|uniref:Uncharacterized protein n=1 Tax=Bacillus wiedmannii TaxID=1890302 RepID=A0AB37Z1I2_9BACI|nr:Protein of unknown function [Bacillus wiedmannii]
MFLFGRHRWKRDAKTCGEGAEKLQNIVCPNERSRRTGLSWRCCSFSENER